MTSAELLLDAFSRVRGVVHDAVEGLDADALAQRVGPDANSIAWLLWHLTRVQDHHVAELLEAEQVWTARGWAERFALPFDARATGYGQSSEEVGSVRASGDLLVGYYDEVQDRTDGYVAGLTGADLDRIVDRAWDPPVTLGVRLVSVLDDDIQHAGQAAYVRGLLLGGG